MIDLKTKRVMVTGGAGFLGRHIVRVLQQRGCTYISVPRSRACDLRSFGATCKYLRLVQPQIIIHAAASCGGIGANQAKSFAYWVDNMAMGVSLLGGAVEFDIEKFVQISSVCAYPDKAVNSNWPTTESELFAGYPEKTNAAYGIAKRALLPGLVAARADHGLPFAYLILANLYGPGDNFDPQTSHVVPAMIRKLAEAKERELERLEGDLRLWGTGRPTRDLLYVEDAAEAVVLAAEGYDSDLPLNIASGHSFAVNYVAQAIAKRVGYHGRLVWNAQRPDGQMRREFDTERANRELGWIAETTLHDGLDKTVEWWEGELSAASNQRSEEADSEATM